MLVGFDSGIKPISLAKYSHTGVGVFAEAQVTR